MKKNFFMYSLYVVIGFLLAFQFLKEDLYIVHKIKHIGILTFFIPLMVICIIGDFLLKRKDANYILELKSRLPYLIAFIIIWLYFFRDIIFK